MSPAMFIIFAADLNPAEMPLIFRAPPPVLRQQRRGLTTRLRSGNKNAGAKIATMVEWESAA